MPGVSSTMAFRCPTSRLNNVDFPTLERPTMATTGLLMTRKTAAKPPPQPTQSTQTTQSTQSPASPLTPGDRREQRVNHPQFLGAQAEVAHDLAEILLRLRGLRHDCDLAAEFDLRRLLPIVHNRDFVAEDLF